MKLLIILALAFGQPKTSTIFFAVDTVDNLPVKVTASADGHYFLTYSNFNYIGYEVHDCLVFSNKTLLKKMLLAAKKLYDTSNDDLAYVKISTDKVLQLKISQGTVFLLDPRRNSVMEIHEPIADQILIALSQ